MSLTMKKPLVIGLAILIPVVGYLSFFRGSSDTPEETPIEVRIVPVTTETIGNRKSVHETVFFTGTVTAEGVADVVARATGTVVASIPAVGSRISEGTILATIDDRSGSAASYLGFRSQDIREAGLSVERAKKTYTEAKRDDNREDTHDSELAKDLARANLSSAESSLQAAIDTRTVRSPLSGIITKKDIAVGDTITVGSPLFTIEKTGAKRIVRFFVSENERSLLHPGMTVRISTGSTGNSDGKLLRVASAADTDSGRFLAEAELSGTMASGTTVSIAIDIVRVAGSGNILLPLSAITFGQDTETIFIEEDGLAKRIPVSMIRIEGEIAEVSTELGTDTHVIIENAKRVKDGSSVSVTNR
jgi:membrane fusion protein, multidrug efflux system